MSSGDEYMRDPHYVYRYWDGEKMQNEKSANLAWPYDSNMLSGLMSRWMTSFKWRNARAYVICLMYFFASFSVNYISGYYLIYCKRVPSGQYSKTRIISVALKLKIIRYIQVLKKVYSLTILGWRSRYYILISQTIYYCIYSERRIDF